MMMSQETSDQALLAKTTRMNLLFDCYEQLLTERQRTYMKYYFHDDYSLGEIAAEFEVSRQAVYDQLKRTETLLEQYEGKLGLLEKYEERQRIIQEIRTTVQRLSDQDRSLLEQWLVRLEELDRV